MYTHNMNIVTEAGECVRCINLGLFSFLYISSFSETVGKHQLAITVSELN